MPAHITVTACAMCLSCCSAQAHVHRPAGVAGCRGCPAALTGRFDASDTTRGAQTGALIQHPQTPSIHALCRSLTLCQQHLSSLGSTSRAGRLTEPFNGPNCPAWLVGDHALSAYVSAIRVDRTHPKIASIPPFDGPIDHAVRPTNTFAARLRCPHRSRGYSYQ